MISFVLGMLIILVTRFISRGLNKRAVHKLGKDKKNELVNLFDKTSFYMMIVFGFIFVLLIGNLKFEWIDAGIAENIFLAIAGLWFIAHMYLPISKLKAHNFPKSYIKTYFLSSFIRDFGLISAIYFITYYYHIFN